MRNKKENGDFQHKIFKLIILIIVFVFFCLIGGFIYVTVSSTKESDKSFKSISKSNTKYYKKILNVDQYNYMLNNNNTQIKTCDIQNFYSLQMRPHIPCIYRRSEENHLFLGLINKITNNNHQNISLENMGKIPFFDDYMKLLSVEVYNENVNEYYFKTAKLDNIGRIFINNSTLENQHFFIIPVSQIEKLNHFKIKASGDFDVLGINNIDYNKLNKDIIFYETTFNKGDVLYIPSYYFIQTKEPLNNVICYEYQDVSVFQEIVFKSLFNIDEES